MAFDDEEDISQEILDRFDLICSQFAATCSQDRHDINGNNLSGIVRKHENGVLLTTQQSKPAVCAIRMTRKTSFGRICSGTPPSQSSNVSTGDSDKNAVERLKREMSILREELFQKVGELASLKEASSRSTNSRLEAIRKLEVQLTSEREASIKTIAALNSQLAFREADYQLISTELTQAKMNQGFVEDDLCNILSQAPGNVSPASALLTSIAEGVDTRLAKRSGRFPKPISPVVTRGPPSKRLRLWSDDLGRCTSAISNGGGIIPTPSKIAQAGGVNIKIPREPIKLPVLNLVEEARNPPTPCKQTSSVGVAAVDAVATSQSPLSPSKKLAFRLRHESASQKDAELCQLVGELTRLSTKTTFLPRDPELPGRAIIGATEEEQLSAERDFFIGLSKLSQAPACFEGAGESLVQCIAFILPRIRMRFQEYVNFFRLYRQCVFDHTFTQKLKSNSPIELSYTKSSCSPETFDCERFGEEPFAGAPASQMVSVPSLSNGRSTPNAPITVKTNELSSWVESTALQASDGILACLGKVDMLLHFARSHDNVDVTELANFSTETLDTMAALLSLTPVDGEAALNAIPASWMSRLARVIHKCLQLASSFALEFNRAKIRNQRENAPPRLPSVMNVYLLVVSAMHSKTICKEPLALLPALRLLTHLLESARLNPPEHSSLISSSSSKNQDSWWTCGGDAEANAFLQKLQNSAPDGQVHSRFLSSFDFRSSSKVPPQTRLGCPLVLLCRLVIFECSALERDDVRRHCRLLTEFSMFSSALISTNRWTRSTTCPCTFEVYKTLISLGLFPVERLFSPLNSGRVIKNLCYSSLGCLTQTLQALLLMHGDDVFQLFTDRIPEFYTIISRLSRLPHGSTDLVHPELVEELHDFDAPSQQQDAPECD